MSVGEGACRWGMVDVGGHDTTRVMLSVFVHQVIDFFFNERDPCINIMRVIVVNVQALQVLQVLQVHKCYSSLFSPCKLYILHIPGNSGAGQTSAEKNGIPN